MSDIKIKKFRSATEIREHSKRGAMGGGLQSVPKEGCTVRFIEEVSEWVSFSEYYDPDNKTFVPMVEDEVLPEGSRPSTRYIANVLWQSEGQMQGKVVAFKMPKKVAIALLNKFEKYGTMTDRDYEITKYGEGMSIEYDVTPEDKSTINLKKYEPLDLVAKLTEERDRAIGRINEGAEDEDEKSTKGKKAPAKAAGATKKASPKRGSEPEPDENDIDLSSLGEAADDGDEEALEALEELATEHELDSTDFDTWTELAEAIAEAHGSKSDEPTDAADDDEGIDADAIIALGAEGDDGDEDAQEELSGLASEVELEPNDFPTWAELADAIIEAATAADDDEAPADDDDAGIDTDELIALAKKADKGNEDAQEELAAFGAEVELDEADYDTWAEYAEAIIEAASGGEEGEGEGGASDDGDEIDLDTLNTMSLADLRKFADTYDIEHKGLSKKALIQAIIDAAE